MTLSSRTFHALLAVVLITAAVFKMLAQLDASDGGGFLSNRLIALFTIEAELILALWLLAGLYTRAAWSVALGCFALFAAVAAYQGMSGETSCGCFGNLKVNPWYTFAFDLIVVALLLVCRPSSNSGITVHSHPRRVAVFGSIALVAGSVAAYAVVTSSPASLDDTGEIADSGLVVLEPERWIDKPLPLSRHIDVAEALNVGSWTVILYHHSCPSCREALPQLEREARRRLEQTGRAGIALIEMPPYAPPDQSPVAPSSPCLIGKLSDKRDWFATLPVIIELRDGQVISVARQSPLVFPP